MIRPEDSIRPLTFVLGLGSGLAATLALALPGSAAAQVRWDLGAEAGVAKRFTSGAPPGSPSPGFGPRLELQAHLALLPMVRLGLYAAEDLSPVPDRPRSFTAGGLHLRFSPPLLPAGWRTWVFAGFGFVYGDDTGAHLTGQLFEVPAGLGLGRKLTPRTLLFVELGARPAFGFYGRMYEAAGPASSGAAGAAGTTSSAPESAGVSLGHDAVALTVSVGLSLDE